MSETSPAPLSAEPDVRMRGFARRSTVEAALAWVDAHAHPLEATAVDLRDAVGRVLAEAIESPRDVPGFDRAMMDGFALRASDAAGGSPYNPLELRVIGESLPGAPFNGVLAPGQAIRIMTGAPLPAGADAVLPAEFATSAGDMVRVLGEVSPGRHIGRRGEDVSRHTIVLPAGRRLRPQDVGVLSSIGCAVPLVIRQPRVRLIVTGDELLPAGAAPHGYSIADANGPMLAALVERDGGLPVEPLLVRDRASEIQEALEVPADVILISGGSSVGQEDHAPVLLAALGELAIHGVAMRPSSPTGMGRLRRSLVFLLPGNPVSCLCAYDFFAGRAIRALAGRNRDWPYRREPARLIRKLTSAVGRVDYARVQRVDEGVEPLAIGGASVLSSTTRADGFVVVPADSEGFAAGATVDMYLYDG